MPPGTSRTRRISPRNGDAASFPGRSKRPRPSPSRNQTDAAKSASSKQSYDRYVTLARAAAAAGDAVESENLYQHAEHYFRMMQKPAA